MGQHGADAARLGGEALEAEKRVQPDQPAAGAVQPVHLRTEILAFVALEPVGEEEHDRTLAEHAARPFAVELVQRRGDAGAAGPVRHRIRAGGERLVGVLPAELAGDVAEARAEQEGVHAPALPEHMDEVEEHARVLAHRAGNVAERHDRRMNLAPAGDSGAVSSCRRS